MTLKLSLFFGLLLVLVTGGCNSSSSNAPVPSAKQDDQVRETQPNSTSDANQEPADATSAVSDGGAETGAASQVDITPITLKELDERLAKLTGNVVVMDIWSTSCVPCMQEFHHLVELSEKHTNGLRCVSLNVDYIGLPKRKPESYLPDAQAFLSKEKSFKVDNLLSADADADVLAKYEVEAMPAIIVFDRKGEIVAKLTDANASGEGLSYEADVIPLVEKILTAVE